MILIPQRSISEESEILIEDYTIRNSNREKLLGVILDNYLKCDHLIRNNYNQAGKKRNTLARIPPHLHVARKFS